MTGTQPAPQLKTQELQSLKEVKSPVTTDQTGLLTFNNIESLQRLSAYLHASKMLPKQYDTPEKIGTGIQFAIQVGFTKTWLLALRQIAVINGTPSLFGDLPLALVRDSGKLEEFKEFLIDKDCNEICRENKNVAAEYIGAVCLVKRKGFPAVEKIFTVQDAKIAGVWGNNVWKSYPKRMIQMRVRSQALKDEFSDVLNGMSIGEYDHNTVIETVVDSETSDLPKNPASALNNLVNQASEPPMKVLEPEVLPPLAEKPEEKKIEKTETVTVEPGGFADFNETTIKGEVK